MAASRSASAIAPGPHRISFARIKEPLEVPSLLALQTDSFDWLLGNEKWRPRIEAEQSLGRKDLPEQSGLEEIFEEISPIEDFTGTMSLSFRDHRFEPPKYSAEECKEKDMTFSAPLFVTAEFINNETGEIKSQTVFMGDFPLMTPKGTFIINGTERVVVCQLVRSPGVYFDRRWTRRPTRTSTAARSSRPAAPGWSSRSTSATASASASTASASRASPCCSRRSAGTRREDPRAVRRLRVDARHPGEGPHHRPGRRAARHLPQAAPGRAPDAGVRAGAAGEPVLQPEALRPGQGRPLQGQQEARPRPCRSRRAR